MAVVDIVMPKMGESIMDGRILKWFKQPGDKVDRDETLQGLIRPCRFLQGDISSRGQRSGFSCQKYCLQETAMTSLGRYELYKGLAIH